MCEIRAMVNLRRLGGRALLGALALFATATTARAADGCLQMDGSTFVGKNFKIPSKNHCAPFTGFLDLSSSGEDAVDGSACTSADGTKLHFAFQVLEHNGTNLFVTYYLVNVSVPTGGQPFGNGTFYGQYPVGTKVSGPATFGNKCGPFNLP